MRKIEVGVAQGDLARLVAEVAGGEEIVITKPGRPVAPSLRFEPRREPHQPGLVKGKIWIAADVHEALPEEILGAFRGEQP